MTANERYAITVAECADRPKKARLATKYIENLEDAARAVVQPMPREIKHRDQVSAIRRLDATNNEVILGEIGAKLLITLRRKVISTEPIRSAKTDSIGRAIG